MGGNFTKGLIMGSIIGAAFGTAVAPGMRRGRNKKKMYKSGRMFLRKSGDIVHDMVDLFR